MTSAPQRPAGIAAAHAERHAKESRKLAEEYGGRTVAPTATLPEPVAPVRAAPGVQAVTDRTRSGTVRTTFVGMEPRPLVDPSVLQRDREARQRERFLAANERFNRRGRHLLEP